MKTITSSERLDDYYSIADASGCDGEQCENEWFEIWLPAIRKKHGEVYLEEIEDDDMIAFYDYASGDQED